MTPAFATIETWTALSGLGRSKTYYLLADGTLRAIKAGKRTLIDVEHGWHGCARSRRRPSAAIARASWRPETNNPDALAPGLIRSGGQHVRSAPLVAQSAT